MTRPNRGLYKQVARLHMQNIDQGFLASLGEGFLALLYEAIDANNQTVLVLAQENQRVVGFVAGAKTGMGPIYRQLLSQWWRLGWALAPAMLSPRKLWRIAEILMLTRKAPAIEGLPHAELLSIAVDPLHRGKGHAALLYIRLTDHFREQGSDGFRIVVGDPLEAAHRFYKRMGATPVGRIQVHQGQGSVLYVQSLTGE